MLSRDAQRLARAINGQAALMAWRIAHGEGGSTSRSHDLQEIAECGQGPIADLARDALAVGRREQEAQRQNAADSNRRHVLWDD